MNKQKKRLKDGSISRGIEWTDYTWNPIGGCFHACQWEMPDGSVANCYAEDVADRVAQKAYPKGFEHHYWHEAELLEPLKLRQPSKIFVGSMADVFGHWVPSEQIAEVLNVARINAEHTFQFLTKNPCRVLQFADQIPPNCWIGASTPPDFMWGRRLKFNQRVALLMTTLKALHAVRRRGITTWISAEPLTIDVGKCLAFVASELSKVNGVPIDWMVIGAASNGRILYAPDHGLVVNAVTRADELGIKVFFKGNMKVSAWAQDNWREEFPVSQDSAPAEDQGE